MFVPISLVTLCHYGYRIFILTGLPGTELQRKCVQCGNRTCSFGTFRHILAHCGILQDFRCSTHRCSGTAAAPLTASGGAMGRHGAPWGAMAKGLLDRTPRRIHPLDKVVSFLKKCLYLVLFSCVEAFPGSRAFLQSASKLW